MRRNPDDQYRISRDRGFVARVIATGLTVLLLGLWGWASMRADKMGDCAARGFQTLSGPQP